MGSRFKQDLTGEKPPPGPGGFPPSGFLFEPSPQTARFKPLLPNSAQIHSSRQKADSYWIQRVEGEEYDDSNKEGAIIGLVGGFAFGAALGNSFNCSTRERCAAGYGAVFGGVGALVGYVLDKRTKQREVLFQAQ